jgi:UDP-N-acetylglucosamine 2-epimerase (non-hydrolysing)
MLTAMRIVYVVGARPNFVKIAPVIAALRRRLPEARHTLVHTGQHYDPGMSQVFVDDLELPEPDHFLGVGPGGHTEQTARAMARLEPVLAAERPDVVVVGGDVNSTLATALVAAQLGLPLAHVESGLRSFDRTMPEELNRVVADRLSDHLLVHSASGVENLRREGVAEERIHLVGNTMIDTLVATRPRFAALRVAERLGLVPGDYLLVTLHRPALVDGPLLPAAMAELERVSQTLPVVFPVHPRTRRALDETPPAPRLRLLEPVGYLEFLSLQSQAAGVLTDSGGLQEETTFLGVPCFTLRENTERPVTLRPTGTNTVLGLDPARIADVLPALSAAPPPPAAPPPLWDGEASERVADVLVGAARPAPA